MASYIPDPDVSGCGVVFGPFVGLVALIVAGLSWACYMAFTKWHAIGWIIATCILGLIGFGLFCLGCYITFYGMKELNAPTKPVRPSEPSS